MNTFLNRCQKIEVMAQEIYIKFSENQGYAEEVRAAFHKLGSDEAFHAQQFEQLIRSGIREGGVYPVMSDDRLNTISSLAETLHDEARKKNLTEEGALRRALKMEQDFLSIHVNNVLHFENQQLADFFQHLGKEDQAHIDHLKQLLTWWHQQKNPNTRLNDGLNSR